MCDSSHCEIYDVKRILIPTSWAEPNPEKKLKFSSTHCLATVKGVQLFIFDKFQNPNLRASKWEVLAVADEK